MPSVATSSSPLSRMVSAMRVKSPFSHSALFGLIFSNAEVGHVFHSPFESGSAPRADDRWRRVLDVSRRGASRSF